MPSAAKTALFLVVLGGVILGGSYALDATTPDATITYGVNEISTEPGATPAIVADSTRRTLPFPVHVADGGPEAGTVHLNDERRYAAVRAARNGSYTFPIADAGRRTYLTEYRYYAVEAETNTSGTDVYEPYRVTTTRNDGEIRLSAERVSLRTYYEALALPVERADPHIQTLLREGTLETHEPVGWVVVSDNGRFYQIYADDVRPNTGLRVTIHDTGYVVGWASTILGGLWWLYVRGADTKPFGGEYS